jgi:membrane-bound serine protease (ClpP class)
MTRTLVNRLFLFLLLAGWALPSFAKDRNPDNPGETPALPIGMILPVGFPGMDSLASEDTASKHTGKVIKGQKRVYKFDLRDEIGPPSWRQTQAAFKQAQEIDADYIIIHMNTFGGAVDAADRIRTRILESTVPVMVFIDNNAASAGALISIACDSIYMAPGANIGAATVVDQQGTPLPEKYQSYMRSMLRSTAESSGRDPRIAEAMNDPRIYIEGVNDSGRVVTFTPTEAMKHNYCEGMANNVKEVMEAAGIDNYELVEYTPTVIEKVTDFLLNPFISGILIMLIIGGIYFEMQAPGIGFALFVAITAAVLYFAPLYLEGLAANWEIALFVVGVILIGVEIFAIPGFGFIGITGIVLTVLGLTLSLVDHIPSDSPVNLPNGSQFVKALFTVVVSMVVALTVSIYFGGKLIDSRLFGKIVLSTTQQSSEGYISTDTSIGSLVGAKGKAFTMLRPSGKIEIDGDVYDASALMGYIEKGEDVVVVKFESSQLFVKKA